MEGYPRRGGVASARREDGACANYPGTSEDECGSQPDAKSPKTVIRYQVRKKA